MKQTWWLCMNVLELCLPSTFTHHRATPTTKLEYKLLERILYMSPVFAAICLKQITLTHFAAITSFYLHIT